MKTISPFVHSAKQQTESQQDEQAEHTESIHRNAPNPHRPNTLTTDDHSIWNLVLDACIASARLLLSTPVSVGIPPTSNFRRTTGPLTRMCSNHTSHHPPPAVLETLSIGRGPLALKSNRNSAAIQSFKSGHRSHQLYTFAPPQATGCVHSLRRWSRHRLGGAERRPWRIWRGSSFPHRMSLWSKQ